MIRKADRSDASVLGELASQLWPHHTEAKMESEMAELLNLDDAAVFLACENDTAVGFAQCGLRHDYVEGTECSPVGYLEGIYVAETCRGRGIAKSLLNACENWAREQGCTEFASDCELGNSASLRFHLNVGFQEANRIICFTKKL